MILITNLKMSKTPKCERKCGGQMWWLTQFLPKYSREQCLGAWENFDIQNRKLWHFDIWTFLFHKQKRKSTFKILILILEKIHLHIKYTIYIFAELQSWHKSGKVIFLCILICVWTIWASSLLDSLEHMLDFFIQTYMFRVFF